MPTVTEAVAEQSFEITETGETARKVFYVTGALSPFDALNQPGLPAVGDIYSDPDAPPMTNFKPICRSVKCTNIDQNDDVHKISVDYSWSNSGRTANEEEINFAPSGDTVTVGTAIIQGSSPFVSASIHGNFINVDSDGNVGGVDIIDDTEVLTVTQWKPLADYNSDFIEGVRVTRRKTNSVGNFYGAQAGELLFINMEEESRDDEFVKLNFTFRYSRNVLANNLPDFYDIDGNAILQGNDKQGHQYLWTLNGETSDPRGVYTKYVYVATVYENSDYSLLELAGVFP